MHPRYALYFMPPPDTPLGQFGARAIGYDAWSAQAVPLLPLPQYDGPEVAALTSEPARYGFHATLKAPFHLREGVQEAQLEALAQEFASRRRPVALGKLQVAALSQFLALTPEAASAPLNALAADCVQHFESVRAPLSDADRARRLRSPLSARQMRYLDTYGYPYVLEEFRFHMTLTGALPDETRADLQAALQAAWQPISHPVVIEGLALAVQPSRDAQFRVLSYFAFAGP